MHVHIKGKVQHVKEVVFYLNFLQIKEKLNESKRVYLQQYCLFNELQEILVENSYGINDQTYHDKSTESVCIFRSLCYHL